MRWPTLALCFSFFSAKADLPTPAPRTSSSLKVVNIGESVTLDCSFNPDSMAVLFYWYKQILGQKPAILSRFYKHDKNSTFLGEFLKDPRLSLENSNHQNHLVISNLRLSDSATYFCISGYSYMYNFVESVMVMVKGGGLEVKTWVNLAPGEKVRSGSSVVLQCLVRASDCDGRDDVYWLRVKDNRQEEMLHGQSTESEERCKKTQDDPKDVCVYNLRLHNVSAEQTGTYYCAAAACGQVLFGDGIPLVLDDTETLVAVYALSGTLALTVTLALLLSLSALKMMKTSRSHGNEASPRPSSVKSETGPAQEDVHYAALRQTNAGRSRVRRDDTWSECVYSEVRQ